jgi:hypothetical protein
LRTVERENIKELLITAKPKEQWMKEWNGKMLNCCAIGAEKIMVHGWRNRARSH